MNFFCAPSHIKFDWTFENFEIRIIRLEMIQCHFFFEHVFKKIFKCVRRGGGKEFLINIFAGVDEGFLRIFLKKVVKILYGENSFFWKNDVTLLEMTWFFPFFWGKVVMIYYGENVCFLKMDTSTPKKEFFGWIFFNWIWFIIRKLPVTSRSSKELRGNHWGPSCKELQGTQKNSKDTS